MDVYSRNRTEMAFCPRVAENYDVLNKASDFASGNWDSFQFV
ncbi:MAG TPA: hypothetical protein VF360_03550 [Candidatus Methanoperedens sp.]|jgi:hypothetical protein